MNILVTYDVNVASETGQKRLRQVAKVCKDYGIRVQNSVFECNVSEAQFAILKNRIEKIIDLDIDGVRFYFLSNNQKQRIQTLGKDNSYDVNDTFII